MWPYRENKMVTTKELKSSERKTKKKSDRLLTNKKVREVEHGLLCWCLECEN